MKYLFYLILLLSFTACQTDDCIFPEVPQPPAGFTIEKIGEVLQPDNIDNAEHFQMIDANTGYAFRSDSDAPQLFKTTDGGQNWSSSGAFPLGIGYTGMLFTDVNTGYFYFTDDNNLKFFKTINGGASLTEISIPDVSRFSELVVSDSGILYGNTNLLADGIGGIYQSSDGGESWTLFYERTSFAFTNLQAKNGKIFFAELDSGVTFKALQSDGTVIAEYPIDGNEEIAIIDESNILVRGQYTMRQTTDGGQSWSDIYQNEAKIIDFSQEEGILALLNKDYCGDNPNELSAFGQVTFTGESLEEGEVMTGFEPYVIDAVEKVETGRYLILSRNEIWELKHI